MNENVEASKLEDMRKSIVVSSRVRLARNLEDYNFPNKLETNEAKDIISKVKESLDGYDINFDAVIMAEADMLYKEYLLENHLISKANLLIGKVNQAFAVMVSNMRLAVDGELKDISNAYNAEDKINETRDTLRDEGILQIEKGADKFLSINYYLDMLAELEAMGDFMINISQSLFHEFDN